MFVIRYLMAALLTIVGALIMGDATGLSLAQSIGMAFLAVVFLQVLIVGYVIVTAIRTTRASKNALQRNAPQPRNQLFILPK